MQAVDKATQLPVDLGGVAVANEDMVDDLHRHALHAFDDNGEAHSFFMPYAPLVSHPEQQKGPAQQHQPRLRQHSNSHSLLTHRHHGTVRRKHHETHTLVFAVRLSVPALLGAVCVLTRFCDLVLSCDALGEPRRELAFGRVDLMLLGWAPLAGVLPLQTAEQDSQGIEK